MKQKHDLYDIQFHKIFNRELSDEELKRFCKYLVATRRIHKKLAKQEVIKDILKHGSWKRVEELAKELKVQEG